MNAVKDSEILVFLRAPELGRVKTRLARRVGDPVALRLYRQFAEAVLETLSTMPYPVRICYHPAGERAKIEAWLGRSYAYCSQVDGSIGDKMASAFRHSFDMGSGAAVLVGTDIPDLPFEILRDAVGALQTHPAVIGPAADGGYYLIGFTREGFDPAVFDRLPWSSSSVFERTLAIFEEKKLPFHRLPTWHDIDEYEDLVAFVQRNAGKHCSGTIEQIIETTRETMQLPLNGAPID